ncbi:hypothetical protein N7519_001142 [Penicillium mononematosum]|uniref:uncharacterized protein n=1 Tax=Penicillium mononematosum TaxID=268346 RepID=UPI002548987D|nr:uncharacterized protein N7519_001142 [Penicillium mononematosum]KAJ6191121.1 hypothetical protein N7519_001142 [Penicillium mononematosum]
MGTLARCLVDPPLGLTGTRGLRTRIGAQGLLSAFIKRDIVPRVGLVPPSQEAKPTFHGLRSSLAGLALRNSATRGTEAMVGVRGLRAYFNMTEELSGNDISVERAVQTAEYPIVLLGKSARES